MITEKGDSHGNQLGNNERTSGRLGKSKAGDFAAAKNVAGGAYLASPENARSRDIRSKEERQLKEFYDEAQERAVMRMDNNIR